MAIILDELNGRIYELDDFGSPTGNEITFLGPEGISIKTENCEVLLKQDVVDIKKALSVSNRDLKGPILGTAGKKIEVFDEPETPTSNDLQTDCWNIFRVNGKLGVWVNEGQNPFLLLPLPTSPVII